MNKYEIVKKIETFAPPEFAESWDCSGWLSETKRFEVSKIMLCLTVTENIINQARENDCDMIVSHHPLFFVPMEWKDIDIYCAHTNLDKTSGGTTDTLINALNLKVSQSEEFVRYVDCEISVDDFVKKLAKISPNLRYVNNNGTKILKKIGFCAGSGSEFIKDAYKNGADAFVTGDLKFHTAVESPIVLFDIGHFESEILILPILKDLISVNSIFADEKSPFSSMRNKTIRR